MSFFPEKNTIDEKVEGYILNAFFITALDKIPLEACIKIVMLEAKKDNFSIKYTNKNGQNRIRNFHYYVKKNYGSLSHYIKTALSQFTIVTIDKNHFIQIAK